MRILWAGVEWRLEGGGGRGGGGLTLVGMRRIGVEERGCEPILLPLHRGMGGGNRI